jgi:hypothetical protein
MSNDQTVPMGPSKNATERFNNLMEALQHDSVTLITFPHKETGEPVNIIAITVKQEDGRHVSYPMAVLYEDEREIMEMVAPPENVETFDKEKPKGETDESKD